MGLFQLFFEFIKPWIWIPLGIAYVGIIFVVLLENRNVNKALSYIVILIFVPVLGLIVFYFFGRDYRKRIRFKFRNERDLNAIKDFQEQMIHNQENALKHLEIEYGSLSKPARMLINEQSSFLLSGNETKLLINGEEKFPEIVKALKSARHHIHLEYYIFSDDAVGREILEILIEKANEGVEIRILVDGAGSSDLGTIPAKLKKNGIKLAIVTDAPKLKAWIRLATMELTDFFDVVVAFEDTKETKPSRRPFEAALSKLRLKPQECLMVGDWPERDIKGAKRMGLVSCFAKYGNQKVKKTDADYEIDDIKDLLKIVEKHR